MSNIYELIERARQESEDPHNYGTAATTLADAADRMEELHFDLQAEVTAHGDTLDFLDEIQAKRKRYTIALGRILGEALGVDGPGGAEEALATIATLAQEALTQEDAE